MLKRSTYPYYTSNYKDLYLLNTPYSFHFNGKENDNEVKGDGNWQEYGMRAYDPIIGRPPSIDPLAKEYPYYSPYQFFGNNPILYIDLDGAEPAIKSVRTNNNFSQEARDGQLAGGNRSEHPIVITEVKNQLKIGNLKPMSIGDKVDRFTLGLYGTTNGELTGHNDPVLAGSLTSEDKAVASKIVGSMLGIALTGNPTGILEVAGTVLNANNIAGGVMDAKENNASDRNPLREASGMIEGDKGRKAFDAVDGATSFANFASGGIMGVYKGAIKKDGVSVIKSTVGGVLDAKSTIEASGRLNK